MADIELLKRLAEAAKADGEWFEEGCALYSYYEKVDADFIVAANPAAILALIAENEELAERIRLFELIHGGRASELYHQISALHAEVRRLKIAAGEDVPPLPEEFVGPLPENCNARLRRKIKEQSNG